MMKFEEVSYPHTRAEELASMSCYRQTKEQERIIDASNRLASCLEKIPGYDVITESQIRRPLVKQNEATNSYMSEIRGDFIK